MVPRSTLAQVLVALLIVLIIVVVAIEVYAPGGLHSLQQLVIDHMVSIGLQ